jgi:hypothetical protein
VGRITNILRKHFKSCQKSETKKLADKLTQQRLRGGTAPKRSQPSLPSVPKVPVPPSVGTGTGFGHMPRHGNKLANAEV